MTQADGHFAELLAALAQPAAYPSPQPQQVEVIETHTAVVFLADAHAYKVKKPVLLPFLDFSSLAARAHFCREEVRLNAELAPGVYLDVVPIRRGDRLQIDGSGELFDWAVMMQRLPARYMLDDLLQRGQIDNAMLRQLASVLVRFHARAATGPGVDEHGALAAVRALVEENFVETDRFVRAGSLHALGRDVHDLVEAWALRFLHEHGDRFEQRVRLSRVREGHGDLHAGNICFRPEAAGGLVIYDRIEFSPRYRCADVAADLAFLLMDLDHRGYRGFSDYLLREYLAGSEDDQLLDLLDFYKCYRAWVRGKVTALRAMQSHGEAREAARQAAMRYFNLAAGYAMPVSLVLLCGLPGTGKSHAAAQLAAAADCAVLNSDATRKQMAAIPPAERRREGFEQGLYDAEHTRATYAALLDAVQPLLAKGRSVVVDAGFRRAEQRAPFLALARSSRVPAVVVHCDPPDAVVRARLRAREQAGSSESDAGVAVYEQCRASFMAPRADEGAPVVVSSAPEAGAELVAAILGELLAQAEPNADAGAE